MHTVFATVNYRSPLYHTLQCVFIKVEVVLSLITIYHAGVQGVSEQSKLTSCTVYYGQFSLASDIVHGCTQQVFVLAAF